MMFDYEGIGYLGVEHLIETKRWRTMRTYWEQIKNCVDCHGITDFCPDLKTRELIREVKEFNANEEERGVSNKQNT